MAAALGPAADAVVVDSAAEALAAIRLLKTEDGGRAGRGGRVCRHAGPGARRMQRPAGRMSLGPVAGPVGPRSMAAALDRLLGGVLVAADLEVAHELVRRRPDLVVVTLEGDLVSADASFAAGRRRRRP